MYDSDALRRSRDDSELAEMMESHKGQRDRHVAFLRDLLDELKQGQQETVADRLCQHKRSEEEKREKVNYYILFTFSLPSKVLLMFRIYIYRIPSSHLKWKSDNSQWKWTNNEDSKKKR